MDASCNRDLHNRDFIDRLGTRGFISLCNYDSIKCEGKGIVLECDNALLNMNTGTSPG